MRTHNLWEIALRKLLILSFFLGSSISYAAIEHGNFCLAGEFTDNGACSLEMDITEHTKYFSIVGQLSCEDPTDEFGTKLIASGLLSGTGQITNGLFSGSLLVNHRELPREQLTDDTDLRTTILFDIDVETLDVVLRKEISRDEFCGSAEFNTVHCLESAEFIIQSCAAN